MKVTVWADPVSVMDMLAYGLVDAYFADGGEWVDRGPMKRVERTWEAGNVLRVLEYSGEPGYCSVELRGEGCQLVGSEGVRLLLDDLERSGWRWRASRCDLCFDDAPFDVRTIHAAAKRGDFRGRGFTSDQIDFIESERPGEGRTFYAGNRKGEQFLRVYDRRGWTRFELELKGDKAGGAVAQLAASPVEAWAGLMLGWSRNFADFIDRASSRNVSRCALLPWWSKFVNDAERLRPWVRVPREALCEMTLVGKLEFAFQRCAPWFEAAVRAFGEEWAVGRLRSMAKRRWSDLDDKRVEELQRYRGRGLAGIPDREPEMDIPV